MKQMTKLPEGRKPLDNQWYRDKIRAMTKEERQAAKEKEQNNASSEQQQRDNSSALPLRGLCK
jgi:hypothetical protein